MKGSLRGLARRLKEEVGDNTGDTSTFETRRVLTTRENTFESRLSISFEVVPPVPVVPSNDINGLDWNDQGDSRSFQSFQSPEHGRVTLEGQAPPLWDERSDEVADPPNDAEEAERLLRVEASLAFERGEAEGVGGIPHQRMVAGLLAASRMRPKLVINPAPMTTNP